MKDKEVLRHLKIGLKEASYLTMAVLTVLWTGLWSFARKHPFLTGAFLLVCLFIVIGIIAGPDRKPGITLDKATIKSQPSEDDEDSKEDKTAKAQFDSFITSYTKINEHAMVSRAWVPHDRLVNIEVREPQIFAAMADDQFEDMSRFIALTYGKLMGKYIAKKMGKRKENGSEVTFWYNNLLDKSLPSVTLLR